MHEAYSSGLWQMNHPCRRWHTAPFNPLHNGKSIMIDIPIAVEGMLHITSTSTSTGTSTSTSKAVQLKEVLDIPAPMFAVLKSIRG